MKKKVFVVLILFLCLILTGCGNRMDQDEIDRIGNMVNGG